MAGIVDQFSHWLQSLRPEQRQTVLEEMEQSTDSGQSNSSTDRVLESSIAANRQEKYKLLAQSAQLSAQLSASNSIGPLRTYDPSGFADWANTASGIFAAGVSQSRL